MSEFAKDVVITDGIRQYFRPSIYKMEKEIKYEVPDYKEGLAKPYTYDDLTLMNHTYDRLCYVRKRLDEIDCKNNENMLDIMVLLGVEHKIKEQMQDVETFIHHYTSTIKNIQTRLTSWPFKLRRLLSCGHVSKKEIPYMTNIRHQETKLETFRREREDLQSLFRYMQGKILFLTNPEITKLGIIKD